ncbi:helix-turn-helix transcriptional regulator [Mucilaginibacter kameinonensis]|uniref:helix-turn-helix transcriptional regulator n=1 Tax=Mucilaginibacter kameinonensis TaxID=452286 RepID=UPI000EF79DEB|nr:helix-turn-helix transcriptional regulator [Mucilaginibacter kameinonensis]
MSTTTDNPKNIHHGRNVKRFREMFGLKQDALAFELGDDWSQRRVSLLEAKETIEPDLLTRVAKALKVPEEAIKNFDEEKAIYNIQNNYEGSSSNYSGLYHCTFNPLDKLMQLVDENKKLYEQLLASEREKVELLKNSSK